MKGFEGDMLFLGLNPAPGATLAYRLKADAKDVSWVIREGNTQVREITGDAMRGSQHGRSAHREVGPARAAAAAAAAASRARTPAAGGGGGGFGGGGNNGPFVLPGTYRATLRVDGKDVQTVNVVVTRRPRDHHHRRRSPHLVRRRQGPARPAGAGQRRAEMVQNASAQMTLLSSRRAAPPFPPGAKKSMDALSADLERLRRRLGLAAAAASAPTPRTCAAASAS